MNAPNPDLAATRRAGIRRTAWILGACAVAAYVLFLYSAMHQA